MRYKSILQIFLINPDSTDRESIAKFRGTQKNKNDCKNECTTSVVSFFVQPRYSHTVLLVVQKCLLNYNTTVVC